MLLIETLTDEHLTAFALRFLASNLDHEVAATLMDGNEETMTDGMIDSLQARIKAVSVPEIEPVEKLAAELAEEHGHWGEHPKHSRSAWQMEASANDTSLGYWMWVANQITNYDDNETDDESPDMENDDEESSGVMVDADEAPF